MKRHVVSQAPLSLLGSVLLLVTLPALAFRGPVPGGRVDGSGHDAGHPSGPAVDLSIARQLNKVHRGS